MSELIDNQAHRIRILKDIIKKLHAGVPPVEVKAELAEIVHKTDAAEIAAMEQALISEGISVQEVQSMCDLHSEVLREVMLERQESAIPPGHPVDTFRRENEALREVVERIRGIHGQVVQMKGDDVAPEELMVRWQQYYNDLMDINKHYMRKENLLFSYLERHGITGPSKVMWGKDDEVREKLRPLGEVLRSEESPSGIRLKGIVEDFCEPAITAVEEMIIKEEKILFPIAVDALTGDEWAEIWRQSPEYGWTLVEPGQGYEPPEITEAPPSADIPEGRAIVLPPGSMTFEQLQSIFSVLPVDLTLMDADGYVRYFSEGPQRVFSRSKAIIGRKVQHCHPPKSVGVVERIVDDLNSGRHDVAEFWLEMEGKFIHIRYFALRDTGGRFLGILEVTQDITRLRELKGERRLLQYDRNN